LGYANVYEAVPNADGTAAATITDTLVTPFGNFDVSTSYDAVAPLDPSSPLEALGSTSSNDSVSDNAFTIGATTFDPGSGGFDTSGVSLFSVAPLLNFSAGSASLSGQPSPTELFTVYRGGTETGMVQTSLFYDDLLGIDSTQFTVQNVIPTVAAIQSALADNLNFGSADLTAQDLASVLANYAAGGGGLDFGSGDITDTNVY
jgi:hypothetical protein